MDKEQLEEYERIRASVRRHGGELQHEGDRSNLPGYWRLELPRVVNRDTGLVATHHPTLKNVEWEVEHAELVPFEERRDAR